MPSNWTKPQTLGLLGAAAGFLDPRGGMIAGFHGGMAGLNAGNQLEDQRVQRLMQQESMLRKMDSARLLQETIAKQQSSGKTDIRALANALRATGHPDMIALSFQYDKVAPKVKTTTKVMKDGQAYTQPVYDTGEFGEVNSLPEAVKLMQINRRNQIDLTSPYTGQTQTSFQVGMSPGESARLAQSAQQFGASHGLAQQNSLLNQYRAAMETNPEFLYQKARDIAEARENGKIRAGAKADLQQNISVMAEALNLSDDLKNHPALNSMVGNLPKRAVGQALATFGGNKEADFSAKLEQSQGKQFLSAIQYMRGFGQLTEVEGAKMQASAAAMSAAQSPADFKKAQDDYQAALLSGVRKIAPRVGMGESEVVDLLNKERSSLRGIGLSIEPQNNNSGWSVQRID